MLLLEAQLEAPTAKDHRCDLRGDNRRKRREDKQKQRRTFMDQKCNKPSN